MIDCSLLGIWFNKTQIFKKYDDFIITSLRVSFEKDIKAIRMVIGLMLRFTFDNALWSMLMTGQQRLY